MYVVKKKKKTLIKNCFGCFLAYKDDIFATEAIKPSQKTREKERTFDSNLFDDNIDIFADLTVNQKKSPKRKWKLSLYLTMIQVSLVFCT